MPSEILLRMYTENALACPYLQPSFGGRMKAYRYKYSFQKDNACQNVIWNIIRPAHATEPRATCFGNNDKLLPPIWLSLIIQPRR